MGGITKKNYSVVEYEIKAERAYTNYCERITIAYVAGGIRVSVGDTTIGYFKDKLSVEAALDNMLLKKTTNTNWISNTWLIDEWFMKPAKEQKLILIEDIIHELKELAKDDRPSICFIGIN